MISKKLCFIWKTIIVFLIMISSYGTALSSVSVSIPDSSGTHGSIIDIPLRVSNLTNENIYAVGIKLVFDPTVLEAKTVNITGTILEIWGSPTVNIQSGQIIIGSAGSSPLIGSGNLIYITFDVKGPSGSGATIHFTEMIFNEGNPVAVTDDGYFSVTGGGNGPILSINPTNLNFIAVEGSTNPSNKIFNVNNIGGGVLNWSATKSQSWLSMVPNSGTAPSTITVSVNISGLSIGTYRDTITVIAPGAGESPKKLSIALHIGSQSDIIVSIPDTSCESGTAIDIPICITDITGKGIYSLGIKLTYNSTILNALGATSTGTITSSWGSPTTNITNGEILIGMAGSSPLTGNGNLIFINFHVNGITGNSSAIHFTEITFNEGSPSVIAIDGNVFVFGTNFISYETNKPKYFFLTQNHPNPFNAETQITFSIPLPGETTLKMYDTRGREICTLFDGHCMPGQYTVTLRAGDMPSGLYFYQLHSKTYNETRKLIFLK